MRFRRTREIVLFFSTSAPSYTPPPPVRFSIPLAIIPVVLRFLRRLAAFECSRRGI
jgi:hypothetical protein